MKKPEIESVLGVFSLLLTWHVEHNCNKEMTLYKMMCVKGTEETHVLLLKTYQQRLEEEGEINNFVKVL